MKLISRRMTIKPFTKHDVFDLLVNPSLFLKNNEMVVEADEWPHNSLKIMLPLYHEYMNEDGTIPRLSGYYMVDHDRCLIGDLSLKKCSDSDVAVELGYYVCYRRRSRGYATEAVKRLSTWLFESTSIQEIRAETDIENTVSQRVLRKSGFVLKSCTDSINLYVKRK